MSVMLRAKKLFGILDGSAPQKSFANENEWINKDTICQSIISIALDFKYIHKLRMSKSANQMWQNCALSMSKMQ